MKGKHILEALKNLTRYEVGMEVSYIYGPCLITETEPDGEWVKFEDIEAEMHYLIGLIKLEE